MPGSLVMQNDGNLVFYSRFNAAMWATNTGNPAGASSQLHVDGSSVDKTLVLSAYNYSEGQETVILYGQ